MNRLVSFSVQYRDAEQCRSYDNVLTVAPGVYLADAICERCAAIIYYLAASVGSRSVAAAVAIELVYEDQNQLLTERCALELLPSSPLKEGLLNAFATVVNALLKDPFGEPEFQCL